MEVVEYARKIAVRHIVLGLKQTGTHYEVLNVVREATSGDIEQAHNELVERHHPHMVGGDEETYKCIKDAYDVLSKNKKR